MRLLCLMVFGNSLMSESGASMRALSGKVSLTSAVFCVMFSIQCPVCAAGLL